MKKLLLALAITSAPAIAEEQKSTTAKITRAAITAAEPASRVLHDAIREIVGGRNAVLPNESMNIDRPGLIDHQAQRSPRKPMKECIKPGNVIDEDVKECMEGLRIKEW